MTLHEEEAPDSDDSSSSLSGDEAPLVDKQLVSWVCCDLCSKWRRVPQVYASSLNPDVPWDCSHNPDKSMADCSKPQELSNEEIDALSAEAEDGEEHLADLTALMEERGRRRRTPAMWLLIKDNILTYRKRKVQEEDDVMICNCRPGWGGKKGDNCGPDCINRMLCVECCSGFCPCEDACTNQMFSRKQYAKLEVRRAGAKGFGLFAVDPIPASQFVIEYIGEVLDDEEYIRRKEFYAEVGQRHYYFMNIGNGEVIDACRKGNRARFINHSCDPNCETQKWLVKGELAIGLFAVKDIAAGEELTFDYNFERYGDRPIRCYCGSKSCRRFIGGTQDSYDESVVPVDPEDATNDFQPIMLVDTDMDASMKALLDWRVGVFWDKDKEAGILKGLERVCKSRGVGWTPAHYHGVAQLPVADADETMAEPATASGAAPAGRGTRRSVRAGAGAQRKGRAGGRGAGEGEDEDDEGDEEGGQVPSSSIGSRRRGGAREAELGNGGAGAGPNAGALSAALRSTGRRPAASATTKTDASLASSNTLASSSRLRTLFTSLSERDTAAGTTSSQVSAVTHLRDSTRSAGPPRQADSREPREAQSRDELQGGEEWQGAGGATSVRRKVVLDPGQPRSRVRRRTEIDRRLDVLVGPSGRLRDTSRQNIIKVLRMFNLCDISITRAPADPGPLPLLPTTTTSALPDQPMIDAADTQGALPGTPGHPLLLPVLPAAGDLTGRAGSVPPGTTHPQGSGDADALSVVAPSGQQPLPATDVNAQQPTDAQVKAEPGSVQDAPGGGKQDRSRGGVGDATDAAGAAGGGEGGTQPLGYITPAGVLPLAPSPSLAAGLAGVVVAKGLGVGAGGGQQQQQPVVVDMTARQRARMADLSLLLDVILKTSSATIRKQFITCGVLNQLHQAIIRNFNKVMVSSLRNFIKDYSVILRKVLKVVESLPLSADDLYLTRTAHCRLADTLQDLASHQDFDVRSKAIGLLKKYPMSSVSDPALVQQLMEQAAAARQGPAVDRGEGQDGLTRVGRIMQPMYLHTTPIELLPPAFVCPASPPPRGAAPAEVDGGAGALVRRRQLHEIPPHNQGPIHEAWEDEEDGQEGFIAGRVMVNTQPRPVAHHLVLNSAAATAEELYELLYVPAYVVERQPGFVDPVPPLTPLPTAELGIHGEVTDIEGLYAAGLYDMDWEAAMAMQPPVSRRQRKGWDVVAPVVTPAPRFDTLDTPRQAPTSPLRTLALSPVRYDIQVTERAVEDARAAAAAGLSAGAVLGDGGGSGAAAAAAVTVAAPVKPAPPPLDPDAAEWARAPRVPATDSWDEPDEGFQEFVRETVRFRLGKYVTQQDHHSRIQSEAAHKLFAKIHREIIAKEQQAFTERQSMGMFKIIERVKVEHNIREFVRHSIKRYLQTQQAAAAANGGA